MIPRHTPLYILSLIHILLLIALEQALASLFYNQVISNPFGIHSNNEFLKSMELECIGDIEEAGKSLFQGYKQYEQLLMDAAEEIDECGLTFDLEYSEAKNGFHNYKILDVYEG